eukprot:3019088-Rhodomonas_salina.3
MSLSAVSVGSRFFSTQFSRCSTVHVVAVGGTLSCGRGRGCEKREREREEGEGRGRGKREREEGEKREEGERDVRAVRALGTQLKNTQTQRRHRPHMMCVRVRTGQHCVARQGCKRSARQFVLLD